MRLPGWEYEVSGDYGSPVAVCGFSGGWVNPMFRDGQEVEDSLSTKASWEVVSLVLLFGLHIFLAMDSGMWLG